MFDFTAYFNGNNVLINEKNKYSTNEILTILLNTDINNFYNYQSELKTLQHNLTFRLDGSYIFIENFDNQARKTQNMLHQIIETVMQLPIYNNTLTSEQMKLNELFILFEEHQYLFDDKYFADRDDDSDDDDEEHLNRL
jgi:hypothetical protein